MPRELDWDRGRDLVAAYQSGLTVHEVASQFKCQAGTVCKWVVRLGMKARSRRLPVDVPALIAAYAAGESLKAISDRTGVARIVLTRRLNESGVEIRGRSEAERLKWSRRGDADRARQMVGAHTSKRGMFEDEVAAMLSGHGFTVSQQHPVGPYHLDIAIDGPPVAVEVTCFCPVTFRRTNSRQRTEYLLNRGWLVVYLRRPHTRTKNGKVVGNFFSLPHVEEQLVPLLNRSRSDPSVFGKYRVLFCHPEFRPAGRYDLDGLSAVEAADAGKE